MELKTPPVFTRLGAEKMPSGSLRNVHMLRRTFAAFVKRAAAVLTYHVRFAQNYFLNGIVKFLYS